MGSPILISSTRTEFLFSFQALISLNMLHPSIYMHTHITPYFSFGPAINTLIPLPAFTASNACAASSNRTVPVINFLTSTLPLLTRSTANL